MVKLPNNFSLTANKEFTRNLSTCFLTALVGFLLFISSSSVRFNDGFIDMSSRIKTLSYGELEKNYPWHGAAPDYDLWYQNDSLYVFYQHEVPYMVMLKEGKLEVSQDTMVSNIDGCLVYLYQFKGGYQALWQYKNFIVAVKANSQKSEFIQEIKNIMKENLK